MRVYTLFILLCCSLVATSQDIPEPTLYLPFDGDGQDATVTQHSVSGVNSITFDKDREDINDRAARFDGQFSSLSVRDNGIVAANNMTVSGWFNFEGTLPNQQSGQIINKYRWNDRQRNFRVACEEGAFEVAVWYGPELPDFVQMRVPVATQRWNHFAFTISSQNEFKLYLNGCLLGVKQLPGPMQRGEQPIRVGNAEDYGDSLPGDNHHFNGRIDELRVYAVELPAWVIERQAERKVERKVIDPTLALTFNGSLVDSSASAYQFTGTDVVYGRGQDDFTSGGAAKFNGSTTEVSTSATGLFKRNDFTVAGWFNFTGVLPGQQTATVIAKYTWDDGQRSFLLSCTEEEVTLKVWYGLALADHVSIVASLTKEQWHRFSFSVSTDNQLLFYLDDHPVGTVALPGGMQLSDQPLRIGNASQLGTTLPGDNHHFQGLIDEVRVYNKAVSACQMLDLTPSPYRGTAAQPDVNHVLRLERGSILEIADNDSLDYAGSMTLSAWILPTCSEEVALLSKQWCRDYGYYLGLRQHKLFWSYNDVATCGNPNEVISEDLATVDSQWHHAAVVHTNSRVTIYLDGRQLATRQVRGRIKPIRNTSRPFVIGGYYFLNQTYGSFYDGFLDNVRLYRRALDGTEVRRDMQGQQPIADGVVLNLDMENSPRGTVARLENNVPGSEIVARVRQVQGGIVEVLNSEEINSRNYAALAEAAGCADQFSKLIGRVYADTNGNGRRDAGEPWLQDVPVHIATDSSATVFTDQFGEFELTLLLDTPYVISVDSTTCLQPAAQPETISIDKRLTTPLLRTYAMIPQGGTAELTANLVSGPARCGFTVPMWVTVTNAGCASDTGTVRLTLDSTIRFVTSSSPYTLEDNTISWKVPPLYHRATRSFKLLVTMPDESFVGDTLTTVVTMAANSNEGTMDSLVYYQVLRCAIDPNDKLTYPARPEPSASNYTQFGEQLRYTIRFQNTGTDTAFTVVLRDTLSALLDVTTFTPVAGSHPYRAELSEHGVLEVTFADILLPDSTVNEVESHGYFTFRVTPVTALSEGQVVTNSAGIYFDFNQPIITNTVKNTFVEQLDADGDGYNFYVDCDDTDASVYPGASELVGNGVDEDCNGADLSVSTSDPGQHTALSIYPNPTDGSVTIRSAALTSSILHYRLYTLTGQVIAAGTLDRDGATIDVEGWSAGTYLVAVYSKTELLGRYKLVKR